MLWPLREVDELAVNQLASGASVSPVVARLLLLRGVKQPHEVEQWLHPAVVHFHDPTLLPDFSRAVDRLRRALRNRETVVLWGHDDLDGITSVVLLYKLLTSLRGRVVYHIPTKGRDRHGLTMDAAANLVAGGVKLVVTVDCGITNVGDIAALATRGVDVIVIDHHEVLGELPPAIANVDPKRSDSCYPYRGLAGVGVAFKLGAGLVQAELGLSIRELLSAQPELLTFAVLGTIADRVPLTGENRTLVSLGLPRLQSSAIPAVRAVVAATSQSRNFSDMPNAADSCSGGQRITVMKFLTELLPLFAAANGNDGVERFLAADDDGARRWVEELSERAANWLNEASRSFEVAERIVQKGDGIVFARSRELSLRALGYCAARLKERYQVPAVVIGCQGDFWVGECRGVEGVDLIDLLRAHAHLFIDYGGHQRAAGFSIAEQNVDEFIRSAEEYAHKYVAGRIVPDNIIRADAVLPLASFDRQVLMLAPFGEGNPVPRFISEPVRITSLGHSLSVDVAPQLRLQLGRGVQLLEGTVCRLLYSVDDLARITVEGCVPVTD